MTNIILLTTFSVCQTHMWHSSERPMHSNSHVPQYKTQMQTSQCYILQCLILQMQD